MAHLFFCADLVRHINVPVQIEMVSLSSYEGTESSGEVSFRLDVKQSLVGKKCLSSSKTLSIPASQLVFLLKHMKLKNLKKFEALLTSFKERARFKIEVPIDYLGFDIEDKFVIGYGLDFDGRFRELPYIGVYGE